MIGSSKFARDLCDLGANINLIPLAVFKKLILRPPKPTIVKLLLVDHTVKKPMGISMDVLVKVDNFFFFVDFVILD